MGRRKPFADESLHSFPPDTTMLASPTKSAMPEVAHGETKVIQCMPIARNSEVTEMPSHYRLQPLADFRNGVMHPSPQLDLHQLQLGGRPTFRDFRKVGATAFDRLGFLSSPAQLEPAAFHRQDAGHGNRPGRVPGAVLFFDSGPVVQPGLGLGAGAGAVCPS